jgi:hypothetical protein
MALTTREAPSARLGLGNAFGNFINGREGKAREKASSSKGIETGTLVKYQGKTWEVLDFHVDETIDLMTPGEPNGPKKYNVDPRNVQVIEEP